jgi:hypothetical protein
VKVACPQCGGEVEFRFDDTFVRVCTFCNAAVVRLDRGVETLGKFADLIETGSPLALYADGTWQGRKFQLVGRAQLRHAAGGSWDEWYARFDDGNWGWLSEAQGRFYLLFELPAGEGAPSLVELKPGVQVAVPGSMTPMTVAETAEATYLGAAGEIPFKLVPGSRYFYADLSGPRGAFATIDFSGPSPSVYVGAQVAVADLHVSGGVSAPPVSPSTRATRLACPNCDGSIELRAPDATMRVGCPFCGALLDARAGALVVLTKLAGSVAKPTIPLGAKGTFEDTQLTVIGWMRRAAQVGGVAYPFEEYLLYRPELGFRWLVEAQGSWSYVKPVDVGEVTDSGDTATYAGVKFKKFAGDPLVVDRVLGEMYWKVTLGERVQGTDFVAPPAMLSKEEGAGEINWSLGAWMSRGAVERAFPGVTVPAVASAVAPNQPPALRGAGTVFGLALVGAIGAAIVVSATTTERSVVTMSCDASSTPPPSTDPDAPPPGAAVCFSEPFTLEADRNIAVILEGNPSNSWISVGGDLVNDATGETESFDQDLELYFGVDDGESWSEGSARERVFLDPVPAGRYALRLELQGQGTGFAVTAEIRQGVFHFGSWLWIAGLVVIPGLLLGAIWWSRERARWKDSDFAPATMGSSDD